MAILRSHQHTRDLDAQMSRHISRPKSQLTLTELPQRGVAIEATGGDSVDPDINNTRQECVGLSQSPPTKKRNPLASDGQSLLKAVQSGCSSECKLPLAPARVLSIASRANAKSLHALWPIRVPTFRLRQSERHIPAAPIRTRELLHA